MEKTISTIWFASDEDEDRSRFEAVVRRYLPGCRVTIMPRGGVPALPLASGVDLIVLDEDLGPGEEGVDTIPTKSTVPVLRLSRSAALPDSGAAAAGIWERAQWSLCDGELGARIGLMVRLKRTEDLARDAERRLGEITANARRVSKAGDGKSIPEKLRQSQRMEAVGQLAGGVAHDFNNILTAIRGYSDIMLDSLREGDPLADEAREIKKATQRAAALTRQLLAFSRRQVMEPTPLDLNTVVLHIKRMLMRLIGEHIELVTELDPDLGIIKADRSQLEQVIMNLALNARDAIETRGRVTLRTRNATIGEEAESRYLDLPPGPYVLLEMTDTGMGMSEETLFRIFEPFFSTKGQDRGTGLGLSTVYGIVKQSGGDITVTSQEGEGTSFFIYLPIALDLSAAMAAVTTERGPAKGVETILLVEDDDAVRYLTKRLLERAGYTVLPAGHGGEALRICEEHEGPIHLIVTDVVMPEMGGLTLVERLLERHPALRAIFMSGYSDRAIMQMRETLPHVAFLQKPFSYEELTRKVHRVLDTPEGRRYESILPPA